MPCSKQPLWTVSGSRYYGAFLVASKLTYASMHFVDMDCELVADMLHCEVLPDRLQLLTCILIVRVLRQQNPRKLLQ